MDTLLIRLVAPMQSWGVQSLYDDRDSAREPSKSGVIGMLCAALGRPRWQSLADLAALRMGVRVDREGALKTDYQTIKRPDKPVVSRRAYLSDAAFMVGLEGESSLLGELQHALIYPRWVLYLGRKSFPPAEPVWLADGLRAGEDLRAALTRYPRLVKAPPGGDSRLRFVFEEPLAGETAVADVPVSFAERRFQVRRVRTEFIEVPDGAGG
jgi:CRISPR system Cascade subunit CasD